MSTVQNVRNRFRRDGRHERPQSRFKFASRLISMLVVLMILAMGIPAMVTAASASYAIPGAGTLNFSYGSSGQKEDLTFQTTLDGGPISGGSGSFRLNEDNNFTMTITNLPANVAVSSVEFRGSTVTPNGSGVYTMNMNERDRTLTVNFVTQAPQPTDEGEITIDKTATPFDTYAQTDPFQTATQQPGHRKTDVTLTVDANPVGSPTDLVLVLDVSYSMTDSKLSALKSAAKSLVQRVLDGDPDSRVAIVRYSTEADAYNFGSSSGWREYSDINTNSGRTYFTSSRSAADGVIDGLSRDLYTNTEGGFMAADRVMELDGRSDAEFAGNGSRVIVFMTDGVPTAHYNDNLSTSISGGQSSATDINQAMAAGAAAMTQTKGGVDGDTTIFTIGLVSGMEDMEVSVARLLLHNQAHVDSISWSGSGSMSTSPAPGWDYETQYFETMDPSTLDAIYATIGGLIDVVATDAVVTDVVSAEWTVVPGTFLVDGSAAAPGAVTTTVNGDGTTTITWNIGDINTEGTSLTYTISGKTPYYGVADTNDSATLTFNHVLAEPPEGSTSPMTFPIPEAQLNAFTADDSYTTAWNSGVTFDVRDNDPAANTLVNQSGGAYTVPAVATLTPMAGTLMYSRAGVSGTLTYNPGDQTFTYTPDGAVITEGYTVSFPYYLTGTTETVWMAEPSRVTITVTPYEAEGSVTLEAMKSLIGRGLTADAFSFELRDEGNALLETVGNAADGSITFSALNFDEDDIGQTYTYTIREVVPASPETGMTYDPMVLSVAVTVTDAGNGVLTVTRTTRTTLRSTTRTRPMAAVTLEADKILIGRDLADGEFTFELLTSQLVDRVAVVSGLGGEGLPRLLNGLNTVLQSKTNAADGSITFDPIYYTEADIGMMYTYIIREVVPAVPEDGMVYDPMEIVVTVLVADAGNGVVTATPRYPDDTTFDNEFLDPEIDLVKVAQNLTTGGPAVDNALVTSVIGDAIRYTVTVTNTGNLTLYNAIVADNLAVPGSDVTVDGIPTVWLDDAGTAYVELGTMAAGTEVVLTYDYEITAADAIIGLRTNIATVTADSERTEETLTTDDDAVVLAETIPLTGTPKLTLTKLARNLTQDGTLGTVAGGLVGDEFEYQIVVKNSGDMDLGDVVVYDDTAAGGAAMSP